MKNKLESFRRLINRAKKIQEAKIWKWASLGKVTPAMAIFFLKNHCGAVDKVEHDVTEHKTLTLDATIKEQLKNASLEELREIVYAEIPEEEDVIDVTKR